MSLKWPIRRVLSNIIHDGEVSQSGECNVERSLQGFKPCLVECYVQVCKAVGYPGDDTAGETGC